MNKKIFLLIMSVSFMMMAHSIKAVEFKDVHVPDMVNIEGSNDSIKLNGVGLRTKFFFDIYVGALYLKDSISSSDDVISDKSSKRIFMHFVYEEVPVEKLVAGWNEGFRDNLSEQYYSVLADKIKIFNTMFSTMHAGDEVLLDYLPDLGTRITIKGEVKGLIEGKDFNDALLNIWLGDEPADDGLKEAMLNIDY